MLIDHRNMREFLGRSIASGSAPDTFSGVCVDRSSLSDLVVSNFALVTLDYGAGPYDVGGWFNPSFPQQVTVPAGVTRVRAGMGMGFTAAFGASNLVVFTLRLNGVDVVGAGKPIHSLASGAATFWYWRTPVFDVSPGDNISLVVFGIVTPATYSIFGTDFTSLCVEAIQ